MADQRAEFEQARLETIGELCWMMLDECTRQSAHPMRFPVLATRSGGGVDARVLVLRRADKAERLLEFHTDIRSAKIAQIDRHADMIWVFYDPDHKLQLRARGRGYVSTDRSLIDERWQSQSVHTQRAYTQALDPGTRCDKIHKGAPCAHVSDPAPGRANFAVVECVVDQIEWLLLSRDGHQRAIMQFNAGSWSSSWVMP